MLPIRIYEKATRRIVGTCEVSPGFPLAALPGTTLAATVADFVKQFGKPHVTAESLDADRPELVWLDTVMAFEYRGPVRGFVWYPPPIPAILTP